jgi:hypothetical protein
VPLRVGLAERRQAAAAAAVAAAASRAGAGGATEGYFLIHPKCCRASVYSRRSRSFVHTHIPSKMSSSSDVTTLMSMFSNLGKQEIESEYRCTFEYNIVTYPLI